MIRIYNTLTRKKEIFKPIHGKIVKMYACGPTVYHYAHIGNLRTYVFEDILKRTLIHEGFRVKHVMNITDVGHLTDDADSGEDKIEKGARREGKTAFEIADFYAQAFQKDLIALNILAPNIWCKATDNIKEQIALVFKLAKKGLTYETKDGIYFDTTKISDYGKLSGISKQKIKAGARVEMGEKKHPNDFALWKFTKSGETRQMEWAAFGKKGFPGWHIECSAMGLKYLGSQFDIHCGGIDHIPVHHTNEIAQSEAVTGKKPWVKYWLHGEFLNIKNTNSETLKKMAKSGENFITIQTIADNGIPPLAYRYFLLQTHYRKQIAFSWEALKSAENGFNHLKTIIGGWNEIKPRIGCANYEKKFFSAVNDDLNTPKALAILWDLLKSGYPPHAKKATLLKFDEILGLGFQNMKPRALDDIPANIQKLANEREEARAKKNWALSDILRQKILSNGFMVEDTANGQKLTKLRS